MQRDVRAGSEQQEDPGQATLVEGEVLGDEQGLLHAREAGQRRLREGEEVCVVNDGRVALGEAELDRAALGRRRVVGERGHGLAGAVEHLVREDAQAALGAGLARDGVSHRARLEAPEAQQAGLAGLLREPPAHRLGRRDEARRGRQGVAPLPPPRDVARASVELRRDLARAGEKCPRPRGQRAGRQLGPQVEPKDALGPHALEEPACADARRAAGGLLGWLEHHEHVARQVARADAAHAPAGDVAHPRRRRERHGHVPVVPAGVHATGARARVGRARPLGDGKRVHVRPDRHARVAPEVEPRAERPRAGLEDLAGEVLEHAAQVGERLGELVVELGDAVEVATPARERGELAVLVGVHGSPLENRFEYINARRAGAPVC